LHKRTPRLGKWIVAAFAVTALAVALAMHGTGWGQATGQSTGGSVAASAQLATAQTGESTLRVNSRETVVDVTVTDGKGHPIHDLKQSDFTVKEDGKPQPLRSFQEFSQSTPPAERTPPPLPPNVYTNLQQTPTTSAVNILLLDALNTQSVDQAVMKQESLKYLKSMPRGTRIAVLGLTSSLRILQGFTSDPSLLIAAVDSKKNRALPSPFIDNDSGGALDSQVDEQTELGNDDIAAGMQQFENELATEQQDIRNRMTLEALNQIAAYVNGIKGRKNLIWFTEGMPLNMFPTGGSNDLAEITGYAMDERRTTDLLAAAQVAVYPVDARRLFNNPANGADQGMSSITVHTSAQQSAKQIAYAEKKGQEQLSMSAIAEDTGGVAYFNTNDLKSAVDSAIENGANYYSLSYIPPDLNFDGRFHTISVEVDRPNMHLTYRKGYNADDIVHNAITPALPLTTSAPEPYGNNMQASMARGVPTSTQMLFDVRVTPSSDPAKPGDPAVMGTLDPKLQGKALVRYDVLYFIPAIASQIQFAVGPDGSRKCSLEFDLAAYDVYGKRITGLSQTSMSPSMTADQVQQFLKQKQFQFLQQLDLPPGEIFLRVGVLDAVSQKVGTLEIPLNVKKRPAATAVESGGTSGN
jgi:VWFA-related protein